MAVSKKGTTIEKQTEKNAVRRARLLSLHSGGGGDGGGSAPPSSGTRTRIHLAGNSTSLC